LFFFKDILKGVALLEYNLLILFNILIKRKLRAILSLCKLKRDKKILKHFLILIYYILKQKS